MAMPPRRGPAKSRSFAALPLPQSGIGRAVQDDNNDLRQQYYGAVGAMRALGAVGAVGAMGAERLKAEPFQIPSDAHLYGASSVQDDRAYS